MHAIRTVLATFPALPVVIFFVVAFSTVSPYFLAATNIEATLSANTVVLVAALGMTVVSASAVISGLAMAATDSIALGVAAALGTGLVFGAINGALIGWFGLAPFITTMGTQLVARGIAFILSAGIAVKGTPYGLLDLGFALFLGVPVITWIGLGIAALLALALAGTTWGREIMLVGSNRNAALYVGVNVRRTEFGAYLLSGFRGGVAGFLSIANLGNAIPGVGDTLLLIVIGAVVLGGTSMNGGEGSVGRTVTGVLLLAALTSGLNLIGIPFYDQLIIQGVLIFAGTWFASRFRGRA